MKLNRVKLVQELEVENGVDLKDGITKPTLIPNTEKKNQCKC